MTTDEELRKRLILLMNGMHYQDYNQVNTQKKKVGKTSVPVIKIGLKKTVKPAEIPEIISFEGEHHFPGYQYLGPGTKFKTRQRLGIEPINDADRIGAYHDQQYSNTGATNSSGLPVFPIGRSGLRGIADVGAGSALFNAAANPWSDLGWKDRGYAVLSGSALLGQGIARLHPVTALPMAVLDAILY